MSCLALFLLGPPRIERDGKPIRIQRRKAVALLAYLAVTGRSHSRDALATLLWPEYDQRQARAGLRVALAALKKTLGESWLDVDEEVIYLHLKREVWLDVAEFQERLAACRRHGHPEDQVCPACLPLLAEAATLYRDDFLAGFTLRDSAAFDEFQFFQTEGLRDQLASALQRLVRHHSSQGEYEAAIPYARRWLALDPLHEPAHRHLMELYAQAGRHTAALRQYRACMRVLEEELRLAPSAETTALYERIRSERARPAGEVAAPIPPPSHTPLPAFLTREEEPITVERPVFVARESELAQLDGYLDTALAGHGQVVFVTGGPGRGKSVLMREFARRAMEAHPDLLVASGNCNAYSGVGDPYLPFREVAGMLTGDVEARWAAGAISRQHAQRLWAALPLALQALVDNGPSLVDTLVSGAALLSRAAAITSEDARWLEPLRAWSGRGQARASDLAQSALLEQYTNVLRALAAKHPLLLVLDDMQWVDSGSIGLLFHLGRRLEGSRILIACAYRPEEVALGRDGARHPLESVLSEFRRSFGDVWVDLTQADETHGQQFVDGFLDSEPNRLGEGFRGVLLQRTGGHPLFTVELLRAMQARGDLVQDENSRWVEGPALDWEGLPARVEAVIAERVGRLDEELRDILKVASVEGEAFTAQVIAQVEDIPERLLLRVLSQELIARHRLIREEGEVDVDGRFLSRYRFAHALFQEYLYNTLSAGEQRLLHGEIAAVLEALCAKQSEEVVVPLAHHYVKAGQWEKAIEYTLRAGDQARRAYANEEAVAYYQRALALLDRSPLDEYGKDWQLDALKGLGLIRFGTGEVAEAEQYLREAANLGREMGMVPRDLVRLYWWLGEVLYWQGRYDECIRIGEEGLALLADEAAATEGGASAEAIESVEFVLMNHSISSGYQGKGDWVRFRDSIFRTTRFIQRLPYSEELRPAFSNLVFLMTEEKHVKEAMTWFRAFEERARLHHDLRALAEVHWQAGCMSFKRGDIDGAISRYQQALELYARIGDAKHEGWSSGFLGECFWCQGDLQNAEAYVFKALECAKAVGNKRESGWAFQCVGQVLFSKGTWEQAGDAFQHAAQLFEESGERNAEAWAILQLAQVCLAQGGAGEAIRLFQEATALARSQTWWPNSIPLAAALSGLEEAYDDPQAFRAFCRRRREEHSEIGDSVGLSQAALVNWFLELADVKAVREPPLVHDRFGESLSSDCAQSSDWVWEDPFGDCSFAVQNGLEIYAANGRGLWHLNLSAPHILRPVPEGVDWAAETICGPASSEKPATGGILLWKDSQNWVHLDRGTWGNRDITFFGCVTNQDVLIGRGRLAVGDSGIQGPGDSDIRLRLERTGDRVKALCSANGVEWFTAGSVAFPVEEPVKIGLLATSRIHLGWINLYIFRSTHPDGTAIRFESFQLWRLNH